MFPLKLTASVAAALVCACGLTCKFADAAEAIDITDIASVTDATLREPPAADWLMWRRDYSGSGYSPLTEISPDNVADLELAWEAELQALPNLATPLVHDGVMYLLSTPDIVLALDARSGEELWRYEHDLSSGSSDNEAQSIPPTPRTGMALHGHRLIVPTSDMQLLALDSRSGEVLWRHQVATPVPFPTPSPGYYALRAAPLIAGDIIVQGITATMVSQGGFILGIDLQSGEEVWRFHTVARPDEPGGNTWNNLSLPQRSGGSVWVTGSYDPELDLVYFGAAPTYDTAPLLPDLGLEGVSNDALYTNSTLALRPATGELAWHYQHMANDQWDLDWAYERNIVEIEMGSRGGEQETRKVVLTAGKMALFDALDAATGEYLFSFDSGLQNVISDIDPESGTKQVDPDTRPNPEQAVLVCPHAIGGRNWQASAYNPQSGILYMPMAQFCMNGGPTGGSGGILSTGVAMTPTPHPDSNGDYGMLQAFDLSSRAPVWNFRETMVITSGLITTGSGLVFGGSVDGSFKAFDGSNGKVLWSVQLGDIPASFPVTYAADGKQYIAVVVGQPSIHGNVVLGTLAAFLGPGNALLGMERSGAAIKVFSL